MAGGGACEGGQWHLGGSEESLAAEALEPRRKRPLPPPRYGFLTLAFHSLRQGQAKTPPPCLRQHLKGSPLT